MNASGNVSVNETTRFCMKSRVVSVLAIPEGATFTWIYRKILNSKTRMSFQTLTTRDFMQCQGSSITERDETKREATITGRPTGIDSYGSGARPLLSNGAQTRFLRQSGTSPDGPLAAQTQGTRQRKRPRNLTAAGPSLAILCGGRLTASRCKRRDRPR